MKNVICFLLAILIVLSLAACGKKGSDATADESAGTEKEDDGPADYTRSQEYSDINYVYQNGVFYYSDKEGLWCLSEDGTPQQIAKGEIGSFATNGKKILYEAQVSDATADEKKDSTGMIAVINTDGTQEQTLVQALDRQFLPISLQDGVLYYIQSNKKVKSNLLAYDIAASEEKKVKQDVFDILCASGSKIYYRDDERQYKRELYCYHIDSDKESHVGDKQFSVSYSQKVFFDGNDYYTPAIKNRGDKTDITVYKLLSDDTTEIVKEIKDIKGKVKEENCVFYQNALYYTFSSGGTDEVYRCAMDEDEPKKLVDTDRSGTIHLAGEGVIFQTDDYAFYCNGGDLKAIDGLSTHRLENLVMWCDGKTAYYLDGKGVAKKEIQLKDEVPSVESYTISDSEGSDSQETGYIATAKTVTRQFAGKFYLTGEEIETPYEATNRLPKVLLDSDDADTVNEEINTSFGRIFENDFKSQEQFHVDYVSILHGNTLSLAIESVSGKDHSFKVYNFDVTTGKLLTDDEFFALSDITLEEAQQQIVDGAPVQFENNYDMKMTRSDLETTKARLAYAKYFYNSDKQMIAVYDLWGTPGAGDSVLTMPLNAYYKG